MYKRDPLFKNYYDFNPMCNKTVLSHLGYNCAPMSNNLKITYMAEGQVSL